MSGRACQRVIRGSLNKTAFKIFNNRFRSTNDTSILVLIYSLRKKINCQIKGLLKIKHPNTAFDQVRAHRSHSGTIQRNTGTIICISILNSLLNASDSKRKAFQ